MRLVLAANELTFFHLKGQTDRVPQYSLKLLTFEKIFDLTAEGCCFQTKLNYFYLSVQKYC